MLVCFSRVKVLICFFCSLISVSSNASPITWNLKFFDAAEQLIGAGQFNYDPSTTICFENKVNSNCNWLYDGNEETDQFANAFVTNDQVDFLSIDLFDRDYLDFTGRQLFTWDDLGPGALSRGSRDDPNQFHFRGRWGFSALGVPFYIDFNGFEMIYTANSIVGSEWEGVWLAKELISISSFPNTAVIERGSFTATIVPIPAAVWFFISGFVLLFRQRFQS